jgi:hypothetical protein
MIGRRKGKLIFFTFIIFLCIYIYLYIYLFIYSILSFVHLFVVVEKRILFYESIMQNTDRQTHAMPQPRQHCNWPVAWTAMCSELRVAVDRSGVRY